MWVIERIKPTKKEKKLFRKRGSFVWKDLHEYFTKDLHEYSTEVSKERRKKSLKSKCDAALQIGTRGYDPLKDYRILATRYTEVPKKKFCAPFQEVAAVTLGRSFAARVIVRTNRQREEMYILPIFSSHLVVSGFLEYERFYQHPYGSFVASVWAAISILLELASKKIPIVDFVYTKEVKTPDGRKLVFSESGYLGFEKLCNLWWEAIEESNKQRLEILREIKSFLENTAHEDIDVQNQNLAWHLANFVTTLDINRLCMIEKLKARILASGQNIYLALNLFKNRKDIEEVRKMVGIELSIPEEITTALAKSLELDERGWMNSFTRLENATNFSQFIDYIERIISRGYYRELQEQKREDIRLAITKAKEVTSTLKKLSEALEEEKKFKAWKSIFLMDVLSKMRFGGESEK